eukprot:51054-Rhodomonas_salina.1
MGGACTKGKSGVTEPVKVEQHAENETLLKQNTHKSENDRASMVSEEDIGTFEPAHAEAIANHKSDYVDHAASKRVQSVLLACCAYPSAVRWPFLTHASSSFRTSMGSARQDLRPYHKVQLNMQ